MTSIRWPPSVLGALLALGVQAAEPRPSPEAAAEPAAAAPVRIDVETTLGAFSLELYPDKAPKSVANFVAHARRGFYKGTIFHRVIPGFAVQGGGYTPLYQLKPTLTAIECESSNGLKNQRGTIAMARTAYPHSANTQFFINVVDNDKLDYPGFDGWGYAVFGRVTRGMDVVDRISVVQTAPGPRPDLAEDVPVTPVVITKLSVAAAAPTPAP